MCEGCVSHVLCKLREATVPSTFCSTRALITWKWNVSGMNSLSSPFSFLSVHTLLFATLTTKDKALFFCCPPSVARSHFHVIPSHHKYSTRSLNHPLSLHKCEPVPVPGLGKTETHLSLIPLQPTEIRPGLQTTTDLPLWSLSRREAEGETITGYEHRIWSDEPVITLGNVLRQNIKRWHVLFWYFTARRLLTERQLGEQTTALDVQLLSQPVSVSHITPGASNSRKNTVPVQTPVKGIRSTDLMNSVIY